MCLYAWDIDIYIRYWRTCVTGVSANFSRCIKRFKYKNIRTFHYTSLPRFYFCEVYILLSNPIKYRLPTRSPHPPLDMLDGCTRQRTRSVRCSMWKDWRWWGEMGVPRSSKSWIKVFAFSSAAWICLRSRHILFIVFMAVIISIFFLWCDARSPSRY